MRRGLRQFAIQIALAAVMLQALMPLGWMPNPSAGAPFTICTAYGAVPGPGAGLPGKTIPSRDNQHKGLCPFGAAPHFATLLGPTGLLPVHWPTEQTLRPRHAAAVKTAARYTLQSPRAPPPFV
jgi:hypothetical protein